MFIQVFGMYRHMWKMLRVIPLADDVIKWKHFLRYKPFVRGIHRSPVNSPYKSQWRGVLMFSSIWAQINGWVNNGEAGDVRRHRAHYDVTVMGWFYYHDRAEQHTCRGNASFCIRLVYVNQSIYDSVRRKDVHSRSMTGYDKTLWG